MLDSVIFFNISKVFIHIQDGNGFLSLHELISLVKNFENHKEHLEKMFNIFDANGDKQVKYICFISI